MILAAHQLNFCPWLPYFHKMQKADVFVLMSNCQFEKNGYTNRFKAWGKWMTNPVFKGKQLIKDKYYTNEASLYEVNKHWVYAIAGTLGINTNKIVEDFETKKGGTERIIELCKHYKCDEYLTNPDALKKYLDEDAMKAAGIKIISHSFSYDRHVFEAFQVFGIEGTQKLIRK